MKKALLFLFLEIITIHTSWAMKRLREDDDLDITKKRNIILPIIPQDLHEKILISHFSEVVPKSNTEEACTYIHNLSLVSKYFNNYLNNPELIRTIINMINNYSTSTTINHYTIAKKINLRSTKKYVQQCLSLEHKIMGKAPLLPYTIAELVKEGADINFQTLNGHFLYIAVSQENMKWTEKLLKLGANIDAKDDGRTALDIAIINENIPLMLLLLKFNPRNKCIGTILDKENSVIMFSLLRNSILSTEECLCAYTEARRRPPSNMAAQLLMDFIEMNYKDLFKK